jgi:hypothetical protein
MPRRPTVRRAPLVGVIATAALTTFLAAPAGAVITPPALANHPVWEASHAIRLRSQPVLVVDAAPPAARAAWRAFQAEHGTAWHASFDRDTGVARRVWGEGIAVPLASGNPMAAASAAGALLGKHLDLLAPGTRFDDFVPLANDWDALSRLRTVTFAQTRGGVPVIGGQISVRIKNDRVILLASEAVPAPIAPAVVKVPAAEARLAARRFVAGDLGGSPGASSVEGPFILALITSSGSQTTTTVLRVRVDLVHPRGSWDVYVDAQSGVAVARRQRLRFASGTMLGHAPVR